MKHSRIIAYEILDREANERRAQRIATLARAGRYETRTANGAGLARYVRRAGAEAWADEKASNFQHMRRDRQQTAYSYIRTVRTED